MVKWLVYGAMLTEYLYSLNMIIVHRVILIEHYAGLRLF